MWKFHDFSITQILREINFGGSRILAPLEPLNFDLCVFLHFLKAEIDQINKIQSAKKWQKRQF